MPPTQQQPTPASGEIVTWHHGLVARWWAEFNQDGPELAIFRRYLDRFGGPVLDAGCGTGRLMVPLLQAGFDVDGADVSPDMLSWCRRRLDEAGLRANLYPMALHQLAIPRRYATVINCGAFGLGGSRADDRAGLRRMFEQLLPGGVLVLDWYLPNFDSKGWQAWLPSHKPEFPRRWPRLQDRRTAADGSQLVLSSRLLGFDPLEQVYEREIRVEQFRGERLLAAETWRLTGNIYFKNELLLMLETAGFEPLEVGSRDPDRPPQPWVDEYLVFVARRPAGSTGSSPRDQAPAPAAGTPAAGVAPARPMEPDPG